MSDPILPWGYGKDIAVPKHPAVMTTYSARMTGAFVARCPVCDTVCAYWDEDDLDENGDLICYGREVEPIAAITKENER